MLLVSPLVPPCRSRRHWLAVASGIGIYLIVVIHPNARGMGYGRAVMAATQLWRARRAPPFWPSRSSPAMLRRSTSTVLSASAKCFSTSTGARSHPQPQGKIQLVVACALIDAPDSRCPRRPAAPGVFLLPSQYQLLAVRLCGVSLKSRGAALIRELEEELGISTQTACSCSVKLYVSPHESYRLLMPLRCVLKVPVSARGTPATTPP